MNSAIKSVIGVLASVFFVFGIASPAAAIPEWSDVEYVTTPTYLFAPEITINSVLVSANSQGRFVAIWSRTQNGSLIVQSSTSTDGVNWSSPVNLSAAGNDSYRSAVTATADGTFIAIWRASVNGDATVFLASSSDGMTWSTPIALSSPGYDAFSPSVASDSNGRTIVAWEVGGIDRIAVVTSSDLSQWPSPLLIPAIGIGEGYPQVAVSSQKGFAVTYYSDDSNFQRIAAVTSSDGTQWGTPAYISGSSTHAFWPSIATSSSGEFVIGWSESDVAYTLLSANGHFSNNAVSHSSNSCSATSPQLSFSISGQVALIWLCFNVSNRTVEASSSEDGVLWSTPETLFTSQGYIRELQITVGPNGEIAASWNLQLNQVYTVEAVAKAPGQNWTSSQTLSTSGYLSYGSSLATNGQGVILDMWEEAAVSDWQVSSSVFTFELPQNNSGSTNANPTSPALAATGSPQPGFLGLATLLLALGIAFRYTGLRRKSQD